MNMKGDFKIFLVMVKNKSVCRMFDSGISHLRIDDIVGTPLSTLLKGAGVGPSEN